VIQIRIWVLDDLIGKQREDDSKSSDSADTLQLSDENNVVNQPSQRSTRMSKKHQLLSNI
jgi:hypothetical protein